MAILCHCTNHIQRLITSRHVERTTVRLTIAWTSSLRNRTMVECASHPPYGAPRNRGNYNCDRDQNRIVTHMSGLSLTVCASQRRSNHIGARQGMQYIEHRKVRNAKVQTCKSAKYKSANMQTAGFHCLNRRQSAGSCRNYLIPNGFSRDEVGIIN